MKTLADAVVYAVVHVSLRGSESEDDDDEEDEAFGAMTSIAAMLRSATDEEQDALADAAKRALAEEEGYAPREEFVLAYRTWMEDVFGDDWIGNDRR